MPRTKPFAWSNSRLTQFELCPLRHKEVDLDKTTVEPESPQMALGSAVHKALEEFCRDGVEFPTSLRSYRQFGEKVCQLPGTKLYEQKLAINAEYAPTAFFAKDAWLRVVVDTLVLHGKAAAALDYKTGKIKPDETQLALNAAVIFAHYPEVEQVSTRFWWLNHGGKFFCKSYERTDLPYIWNRMLPRVNRYRKAYDADHFPPKPGALCRRWCPVKTCQFNGT